MRLIIELEATNQQPRTKIVPQIDCVYTYKCRYVYIYVYVYVSVYISMLVYTYVRMYMTINVIVFGYSTVKYNYS